MLQHLDVAVADVLPALVGSFFEDLVQICGVKSDDLLVGVNIWIMILTIFVEIITL